MPDIDDTISVHIVRTISSATREGKLLLEYVDTPRCDEISPILNSVFDGIGQWLSSESIYCDRLTKIVTQRYVEFVLESASSSGIKCVTCLRVNREIKPFDGDLFA